MPNINVTPELHERLRVRAHRTGRSMAHTANTLLTGALDDLDETVHDGSDAALALIAAVGRARGPKAGFEALWRHAGAETRGERSPL